jgi:hypothetical protein
MNKISFFGTGHYYKNSLDQINKQYLFQIDYIENILNKKNAERFFYSLGIIISSAIGAVLISLSTIIVAINARLLSVNKGLKILQKKGVKL